MGTAEAFGYPQVMTLRRRLASAPLLLALATASACGDDHSHGSGGGGDAGRPTCDELSEICHDSTTDLGVECHDLGHDEGATEEACQAREEECKAECR